MEKYPILYDLLLITECVYVWIFILFSILVKVTEFYKLSIVFFLIFPSSQVQTLIFFFNQIIHERCDKSSPNPVYTCVFLQVICTRRMHLLLLLHSFLQPIPQGFSYSSAVDHINKGRHLCSWSWWAISGRPCVVPWPNISFLFSPLWPIKGRPFQQPVDWSGRVPAITTRA